MYLKSGMSLSRESVLIIAIACLFINLSVVAPTVSPFYAGRPFDVALENIRQHRASIIISVIGASFSILALFKGYEKVERATVYSIISLIFTLFGIAVAVLSP